MIKRYIKPKKTRVKQMDHDANTFLLKYGKRIKQKRKRLKKNITEMAILLKTDTSRLSRIENGKINLTINEIYVLDKQINEYFKKKIP